MQGKDFPRLVSQGQSASTRINAGLVSGLVAQHGKDFRAVMPLASRETKGRADGRRVQEIVREMTS